MASFLSYLLLLLPLFQLSSARGVFCHYMVGTVTDDHARQDVEQAKALGFSGFSLNVGDPTQPFVQKSLDSLFAHAKATGFKLYISIDLYASGNACYTRNPQCKGVYTCFQKGLAGCNGPFDYEWIWKRYDVWSSGSGYYQVEGRPFISTFSSGGFTVETWTSWRKGLTGDLYFVPDFDETEGYYDAADGWWYYWGSLIDGIFSWETAWPKRNGLGSNGVGDVSVDKKVLAGVRAHLKVYMMGLSPLQYKNSYGTNIYRPGDFNLPFRMQNILAMDPQPDYVEFQTWNDGPESHYIGNLWPESNTDAQPAAYANQETWPHTGWQSLVASFNQAFLSGKKSKASMVPQDGAIATGALWYKTINPFFNVCPAVGDNAYYNQPEGYTDGSNLLVWSVVLSPDAAAGPYTVTAWSYHDPGTASTVTLVPGLNYGSSGGGRFPAYGAQNIVLKDKNGNIVMSATGGACISDGCPSSIYNSNYQVVPLVSGPGNTISCKDLPNIYAQDPTICNIVSETSKQTIQEASDVASSAWTESNAGSYLADFLDQSSTLPGGNAWTFDFFNAVVDCGASSHENLFDCTDLRSSTCAKPNSCETYCPPQAYFIHKSIWQLFNGYKSIKVALTGKAILAITATATDIADTFAPVDTELKTFLTVVSGVLSTVSAFSVFAGDLGAPLGGAFGDGVAAFGAVFSDATIGLPAGQDQTGTLQNLIGTAVDSLFSQADKVVAGLFATNGRYVDENFVNTIFGGGAWLNPQVVTAVVDGMAASFVTALNQFAILEAMKAASTDGPYASGYVLLVSTNEFNTKAKCDNLVQHSMIWYDNKCMGFGHYNQVLTGGQNGVIFTSTAWLSANENTKLTSYVSDLSLAIINNYECTTSGKQASGVDFTSGSGTYPACFWNLSWTPIKTP